MEVVYLCSNWKMFYQSYCIFLTNEESSVLDRMTEMLRTKFTNGEIKKCDEYPKHHILISSHDHSSTNSIQKEYLLEWNLSSANIYKKNYL